MSVDLNETHIINADRVAAKIKRLGLKRQYLAEAIGVDRNTIRRWLNGKVKRVRQENLLALAKCLDTSLEELTVADITETLATTEEQIQAAHLMEERDLSSILLSQGEWDLLESVLRATAHPQLPPHLLAKIFNDLSVTCLKSHKIRHAQTYAERALTIAKRDNLTDHQIFAEISLANISLTDAAIGRACDELSRIMEALAGASSPTRTYACLSYARALTYAGSNIQAKTIYKNVIQTLCDTPQKTWHLMNLFEAHIHLGQIYQGSGDADLAKDHIDHAAALAQSMGFVDGVLQASLHSAMLMSSQGHHNRSLELCQEIQDQHGTRKPFRAAIYLMAAKASRLAGSLRTSQQFLTTARTGDLYPLLKMEVWEEMHHLANASNQDAQQKNCREVLDSFYNRFGCHDRTQRILEAPAGTAANT